MAFRSVIKFDGITGTSALADVKGQGYIDVLSYHWGIVNNVKAWEQAPSGTATVHDFGIVKRVDPASPDLFTYCAQGNKIDTVEIRLYHASGTQDAPKKFAYYKFTTCYITSVRPGGSSGGDDPLEEVSFNFAKAEYGYGDNKGNFDVGAAGIQGQ
jgi:type VI secretion system secreted protein Hcp